MVLLRRPTSGGTRPSRNSPAHFVTASRNVSHVCRQPSTAAGRSCGHSFTCTRAARTPRCDPGGVHSWQPSEQASFSQKNKSTTECNVLVNVWVWVCLCVCVFVPGYRKYGVQKTSIVHNALNFLFSPWSLEEVGVAC